jgi:outer membrane protein TolC
MRRRSVALGAFALALLSPLASALAQEPQPAAPAPLLAADPHGLTAKDVRARAIRTSPTLRGEEARVREAEGRQGEALLGFLPRVSATARYVRLSDFDPPAIGGGGSLVGTTDPPGTLAPRTVALAPLSFANVLNQYVLQATLVVPVSDYFLRIGQAHTAQTQLAEAKRWDRKAAARLAASEAEIAYYQWLRALSAVRVAKETLHDGTVRLEDTKALEAVNLVSRAEVFRVEAEVAATSQAVTHAESQARLAERNLRTKLHAKDAEPLVPGETLEEPLPPVPPASEALAARALGARPELFSLAANLRAAEEAASIARAGRLPQISAFADATLANPNPRYQPQTEKWVPTWALGAQLTWSPNEALAAGKSSASAEARVDALRAEVLRARDGIGLEVTAAALDAAEADAAIATSRAQLRAAEEATRVARDVYRAGKLGSTAVLDVETVLTRARLAVISAKVDARIHRARLRLALGEGED